jgi:hypothetical protein
MLPITLIGLGVREGAWLLLLSGSGIPPAQIVTFSLLYFAAKTHHWSGRRRPVHGSRDVQQLSPTTPPRVLRDLCALRD